MGIETMTEFTELAIQTEAVVGSGATGEATSGIDEQIQKFANMYGAQIKQLKLNVETQKEQLSQMEALQSKLKRQSEEDVRQQQDTIQRMFLASSEQLEQERRKIEDMEQRYRMEDKSKLENLVRQTELTEQLDHREKQLLMYIQEKDKEKSLDAKRMEPLGESGSEESLNSSKGYARPTKASLGRQQKASSADKLSMSDSIKSETRAQVHASLNAPLSAPVSESILSTPTKGQRERSPKPLAGKTSRAVLTTTDTNRAERRSPKLKPSTVAEKVTARLYQQPDQGKRTDTSPRRRQDHPLGSGRELIHTRSKSAPGPLRVPPLSPNDYDPSKGGSLPSVKRLTASDPRLPSQMLSSHPRLRQSSSSLASVAESIDESLEDDRMETPGKDSAFDEVSMDTLDSLQDEFPAMSFTAPQLPDLSEDGARSPSPGRPPGNKDPSNDQSSSRHQPRKGQDPSDLTFIPHKGTIDDIIDEGHRDGHLSEDMYGPEKKKLRLHSEGTESGVEIREEGSGDEIISSSCSSLQGNVPRTTPEGDSPATMVEMTTPGSIPRGPEKQLPRTGLYGTEAGSPAVIYPGKEAVQHIEAVTFHATSDAHIPPSVEKMLKDKDAGKSPDTLTSTSTRAKSKSPSRSLITEDEPKRKSRSPSVRKTGKRQGDTNESNNVEEQKVSSGAVKISQSPSTSRKTTPSPSVSRKSGPGSRMSPSPSMKRKSGTKGSVSPSPRSASRESITSGSSVGQDRRLSIDSLSSVDSSTSRPGSSTSKRTPEGTPPLGTRKTSSRKSGKGKENNDEQEPSPKSGRSSGAKKREHPADRKRGEQMLSKPKKRIKDEIPVEIFVAGSGPGGGVSLNIGSEEASTDFMPRVNDPTHELFAKSLRSGGRDRSASVSSVKSIEEITYTEDGTKIVRRIREHRGSVDSLSSADSRSGISRDQELPVRRLPDGQTQSSEDPDTDLVEGDNRHHQWESKRIKKGIEAERTTPIEGTGPDDLDDSHVGNISRDSLDEGDNGDQGDYKKYQEMLTDQLEEEGRLFSDSLDSEDGDDHMDDRLVQSETSQQMKGLSDGFQSQDALSRSAPGGLPKHRQQHAPANTDSRPLSGPTIHIEEVSDAQLSRTSEARIIDPSGVKSKELSVPSPGQHGQYSADSLSEIGDEDAAAKLDGREAVGGETVPYSAMVDGAQQSAENLRSVVKKVLFISDALDQSCVQIRL